MLRNFVIESTSKDLVEEYNYVLRKHSEHIKNLQKFLAVGSHAMGTSAFSFKEYIDHNDYGATVVSFVGDGIIFISVVDEGWGLTITENSAFFPELPTNLNQYEVITRLHSVRLIADSLAKLSSKLLLAVSSRFIF